MIPKTFLKLDCYLLYIIDFTGCMPLERYIRYFNLLYSSFPLKKNSQFCMLKLVTFLMIPWDRW